MANRAAQVFYAKQILSPNGKKSTDKSKHVVFPGKQQAIEVDGISNLDEFNEFSNMSLFVDDHPVKIRNVERSIPQNSFPCVHQDGQGRTVAANIIFVICHVIHLCYNVHLMLRTLLCFYVRDPMLISPSCNLFL
jgi:hypothetical protein